MLIHFPALGPKSHCPIYDLSNSGIMLLVLLTSIHPCHRISWLNRNYLECKHKTKTIRHMKHMCVCIFYIDSDAITVMIQSHYLKWFLDWFLSFLLIIICKSALHTSQSLYLFKLGNPMQGVAYGKTAAEQTTHFLKLFSWKTQNLLLNFVTSQIYLTTTKPHKRDKNNVCTFCLVNFFMTPWNCY